MQEKPFRTQCEQEPLPCDLNMGLSLPVVLLEVVTALHEGLGIVQPAMATTCNLGMLGGLPCLPPALAAAAARASLEGDACLGT